MRKSKADAAKAKVCAVRTKRPKIKGVYLRSVAAEAEVYDISLTIDGERRSRRLSIPPTTSNTEFVRAVDEIHGQIKAEADRAGMPQMAEILNRYTLERRLKPNTALMMKNALKGFDLNDKTNQAAMDGLLRSGYKGGTLKTKLKAIKGFYGWANAKYSLNLKNPVDGVAIPRGEARHRIPTPDELKDFVAYVAHFPDSDLDLLYLYIMVETGARCSTVEQIRPCDMDGEWRLSLYNVKKARRYSVKILITDKKIRKLWKKCIDRCVSNDTTIFNTKHSERLKARMKRFFCRDENGERLSPHSFRHMKATNLTRSGVPIKTASAILDCSDAVLLGVYTSVTQDDVDAAFTRERAN